MQKFVYFYIRCFIGSLIALSSLAYAQNEEQTEGQQVSIEQDGEFRWVSDDLFTYLRAGPGKGYRLLGSVNAGTKIQLLQVDREAGYAEIIDNRQRTGWIEIRYVSRTQSIRDDIIDLERLVVEKDKDVQYMNDKVATVMQNLANSDDQKTKLNRQITQQLEDISRLNEQIEKRERTNNMLWFTRGSILGVSALLIGYTLGIFGRRRKHDNRLM
jgi:SH3 domain protein